MKIGLFGGTFDPVHYGHLILAEEARQRLGLAKVIFIPSACSPHKRFVNVTPGVQRLKMLECAIEGNTFFEVSSFELDRPAPSYTIDTVEYFIKKFPEDLFFFIAGGDTLFEMHGWHRIEELVELCQFAFLNRPNFSLREKDEKSLHLPPQTVSALTQHLIEMLPIGISASEIRKRVARGLSVRYLLPDKVLNVIQQESLYQSNKVASVKN